MIDEEAERAVTEWVRLADHMTGREPIEGRCYRCGERGYLSADGSDRLCAKCHLAGEG